MSTIPNTGAMCLFPVWSIWDQSLFVNHFLFCCLCLLQGDCFFNSFVYGVQQIITDYPFQLEGVFYMHNTTHRIVHTTAFLTPVVQHWLEKDSA